MAAPTNLDRDLGRIEGKLDVALANYGSILRDHEKRLGVLEKDRNEHTGAVKAARWLWGTLTAIVGLVGGFIGGHFHG